MISFCLALGFVFCAFILGVTLMSILAMGARADLEAEIGQYQARVRRLADDCHCQCGDGA